MRDWLSRALVALLLVPGLGLVTFDHASAAPSGQCHWENIPVTGGGFGSVRYSRKQVCPAGVTPGAQPVVRGAPPCDIKSAPPATFCWGSNPCYYKASVVPYAQPATAEPTPGAAWHVRLCLMSGQPGGSQWVGAAEWIGQAPQPPTLLDQSVEATGQIRMPSAVLSFNPTARTLVNVDTWFWADGLTPKELRGTSALGLVAVATPDRLEVDPGDGSAMPACGWVTVKSDRCSYPYRRSSIGGPARGPKGAPAYEASARAVWKVRFELNGAPVVIAGAQPELRGPAMTAPVVVAEVQTIVTGTG